MERKSTTQLMKSLNSTSDIKDYISSLDESDYGINLSQYFDRMIKEKNISKADLINGAMIQRNYGYQILSGEKHPNKDKIIALCISGKFNLKDTQRALEIASEGILYARNKRDAAIIYGINHKLNIRDLNILLEELDFPKLDT